MKHEDLIPGYSRFSEELRRGVPPNTPDVDELYDAYSALERLVRTAPVDEAWRLVRRDEAVPFIERETASDERFRWALGRIYLDRDLSDDSLHRLRAASGNVISVPARPDL